MNRYFVIGKRAPVIGLAIALLGACALATHAPGVPEIGGKWIDEICQARPSQYAIKNIFIRREFDFDHVSGKWGVDARFFSDAQCTRPVFTLVVRGRYQLTGPAAMPGAFNGTFAFDRRALIAHAREAVEVFNTAGCGGAPVLLDREFDVSVAGCAPALSRPIRESGQEYDLVGVDGARVRFGVRTPEMGRPEGRPTQLSPNWLQRR